MLKEILRASSEAPVVKFEPATVCQCAVSFCSVIPCAYIHYNIPAISTRRLYNTSIFNIVYVYIHLYNIYTRELEVELNVY